MNNNLSDKSLKTRERIESIMADLKHHSDSIKLLDDYASSPLTSIPKNTFEYTVYHKRNKEKQKRYLWTRENLKIQIMLLENELGVLLEYCD